jgi:hypothetical protein
MADDLNEAPPAPVAARPAWVTPIVWSVIFVVLAGFAVYVFKACRDLPGDVLEKTGRVIDKAGQALSTVAAAFNQGSITTSFVSYATSLSNTHYLQFATLKQMELFTRTEQMSTGFGYIPLPDVVVEARAPVEYTYYLDLNAPWRLEFREGVIHVFAPPIRFNKPAVDASAITYEVRKGYLKTAEAQENLKQSISSLVKLRAKENIHLVRESGRKQTAAFVEKWLARSFTDGKQYPVKVYFPDETPPDELAIPKPQR